jgi:hypothetical protein
MDALVTCNIGAIDFLYTPRAPCDVVYLEEAPFPLPHLNNRLKGKYCKMMTHRFLPDHSRYIWLDGNVRVVNAAFWGWLPDADVVICRHPDRKTVWEEYAYIRRSLHNEYLYSRYRDDPWDEEEQLLRKYLGEAPLYACRFFARKNVGHVNKAFAEWFVRTLEFCNFDQTLFTLISAGLKMHVCEYEEVFGPYLEQVEHRIIV